MAKKDDLLYEAEAEAGIAFLGPFTCVEDAQLYTDWVLRQGWWLELVGQVEYSVTLRHVRRVQRCGARRYRGKFFIDLTLGRLSEGVLLHELAHVPTYTTQPGRRDHGPAFIRAQLKILEYTIAPILVDHYQVALRKRGFVW